MLILLFPNTKVRFNKIENNIKAYNINKTIKAHKLFHFTTKLLTMFQKFFILLKRKMIKPVTSISFMFRMMTV